jgi:hypothetical protein
MDALLEVGSTPPLWHIDAVGAIHPIKLMGWMAPEHLIRNVATLVALESLTQANANVNSHSIARSSRCSILTILRTGVALG